MKSLRYLQQTEKARAEHDLVFNRMGELSLRDDNLLARGFLYPLLNPDVVAVIVEGLIASSGSGLSVDLSSPATCLQKVADSTGSNEVKFIIEDNDGTDFNIVLDPADLSNDRIDIIECNIAVRSEYTDDNVSIADPLTRVISSTTRDRDFELYLTVQKKTGTPGAVPAPPNYTEAVAGFVLGTVDIVSTTNDLSENYLLNIAIGLDTEFVGIDLRGATVSATTATEIVNNINAAGFGTIASLNGNFLLITAPGVGENSIVKIKQPLLSTNDAYTQVLGYSETPGYYDTYKGTNAWFKVAEIFVPSGVSSLTAANVRTRLEKDTDWLDDEETITNGVSLSEHRTTNPMDHPDGSIFANHLDPSVLNVVSSKTTNYQGLNESLYPYSSLFPLTAGRVHIADIALQKENGDDQDSLLDSEQEFPLNRVDQREEDYATGSGYSVPVSLSEATADKRPFTVGALVDDGSNYYITQNFGGAHSRIGIYITNGGSVTGFTHLQITLHDAGDAQEGQATIPIADLQSVGTGWIYVDLSATLTFGAPYHYHFEMIGETSPTPPVLGNASGTGADTLAFREMYLPTGGKYGTEDENDLLICLQENSIRNSKPTKFLDDTTDYYDVVVLSDTKILIVYEDTSTSSIARAIVADISGSIPSFGLPVTFSGVATGEMKVVKISDTKVFVAYRDTNNSGHGTGIILTISGTVVTAGTAAEFATSDTTDIALSVINQDKIAIIYADADSSDIGIAIIAQVTDSSINYGSPVTFNADQTSNVNVDTLDINKVVITWRNFDTSTYEGKVIVADITDLTPVFGTAVLVDAGNDPTAIDIVAMSSSVIMVGYSDTSNSGYGTLRIGSIVGTTITLQPKYEFHDHVITNTQCALLSSSKAVIIYKDSTNSEYMTMAIIDISGLGVISAILAVFSEIAAVDGLSIDILNQSKIVTICNDSDDSTKGKVVIPETTYIGLVRDSNDDTIVNPGDGFAGGSTGSNYDYINVDFSDEILWANWRYEDYIGIDFSTGRIKLPPSLSINDIYAQYNIAEGITAQDAKNYLRMTSKQSIEESLLHLESGFLVREIEEVTLDVATSVYPDVIDNSDAIIFPATGTPAISFEFKSRSPGTLVKRSLLFDLLYRMSSATTGVIKIDMDMRVNGVLKTARSQTIIVPDTITRTRIRTNLLYLDYNDFQEGDLITITMSRDNAVGSNHTGDFELLNLGVL